jgi:hypothetical protein
LRNNFGKKADTLDQLTFGNSDARSGRRTGEANDTAKETALKAVCKLITDLVSSFFFSGILGNKIV